MCSKPVYAEIDSGAWRGCRRRRFDLIYPLKLDHGGARVLMGSKDVTNVLPDGAMGERRCMNASQGVWRVAEGFVEWSAIAWTDEYWGLNQEQAGTNQSSYAGNCSSVQREGHLT